MPRPNSSVPLCWCVSGTTMQSSSQIPVQSSDNFSPTKYNMLQGPTFWLNQQAALALQQSSERLQSHRYQMFRGPTSIFYIHPYKQTLGHEIDEKLAQRQTTASIPLWGQTDLKLQRCNIVVTRQHPNNVVGHIATQYVTSSNYRGRSPHVRPRPASRLACAPLIVFVRKTSQWWSKQGTSATWTSNILLCDTVIYW